MSRRLLSLGGLCVAVAALCALPLLLPQLLEARCVAQASSEREQCVYATAEDIMRTHGPQPALAALHFAYDGLHLIDGEECHLLAHNLGDAKFFQEFYGADPSAIPTDLKDVPAGLTLCRWGFLHGLIEHLIQNHPTPAFIDAYCPVLADGTARKACYLASGHGLILAMLDASPQPAAGDVDAFTKKPLAQCAQLTADAWGRQECANGVFVKLFEWARSGEFQFSWSDSDPFALCKGARDDIWRMACFRAVVVDFPDYMARYDASTFLSYLKPLEGSPVQGPVLQRALFHLVASRSESPSAALQRCDSLPNWLFSYCVAGAVDGLFSDDHAPRWQEARAKGLCASALVAAHGAADFCAERLKAPVRTS